MLLLLWQSQTQFRTLRSSFLKLQHTVVFSFCFRFNEFWISFLSFKAIVMCAIKQSGCIWCLKKSHFIREESKKKNATQQKEIPTHISPFVVDTISQEVHNRSQRALLRSHIFIFLYYRLLCKKRLDACAMISQHETGKKSKVIWGFFHITPPIAFACCVSLFIRYARLEIVYIKCLNWLFFFSRFNFRDTFVTTPQSLRQHTA